MKHLQLILLLFILLSSCIKPIDTIEIKDFEPKIVMNGLITPNEIVTIHLSQNVGLLDYDTVEFIENAIIELWDESGLIDQLTYTENGFYKSSILLPSDQNQFSIIASAPGYKKVSVDVNIPTPVNIENVDTIKEIIVHREELRYMDSVEIYEWEEINYTISITFSDPPNEKNYYLLYLRQPQWEFYVDYSQYDTTTWQFPVVDTATTLDYMYFESDEPIFELGVGKFRSWVPNGTYSEAGTGFSDLLFDGETITLELSIGNYVGNNMNLPYTIAYIQLWSISKDYYQFLQSFSIYSNDPLDNFFKERVPIYTNIENGLGLVDGYSMAYDSIIFLVPDYFH